MESNIKSFFSNLFENYKDLAKCKELVREWYSVDNAKGDAEQISLVNHNMTKAIRHLYKEKLNKIYAGHQFQEELIHYGVNMTNLIVWMSDQEMLDYSSFLVIVEDILDTFPIEDLEQLFNIVENNLKSKSYSNFNDNNRKLTLLKISNTILKRLSSSMDTRFRGRVQMALASIFPISEKSGANLKGLYNLNNVGIIQKFKQEQTNQRHIPNYRFYKQFWIVFKYLINPFTLFSSHTSGDEGLLQPLDEHLDTTEIICIEQDVNINKLEIFLNNINIILKYFEVHHIDLTDNSDTVLSYPKYLTSEDLFDLQLNDSSFRLTILTQFFIVLKSFLRPVSQTQKKSFILSENDKKKISDVLKSIKSLLKNNQTICDKLSKILHEEENWENWKESGCVSFEKTPSEEFKKEVEEIKMRISNKTSKYKTIKSKSLFKIDTFGTYDFNKQFEVNLNDLKNLKSNFNYSENLNSENPFLGNYVERVMRDSDPEMEVEQSIINTDETFAWKFLRLVSMNDISKLNNESRIEIIIKDYSSKYGRPGLKSNIKEDSQPILAEAVNDEREVYKETNGHDKDKQFIKRKRSIDRSEMSSYSGHNVSTNKKRKLE